MNTIAEEYKKRLWELIKEINENNVLIAIYGSEEEPVWTDDILNDDYLDIKEP